MRWRWDQGRLPYFQFEALRLIANVLLQNEGINLEGDPLREPLIGGVGMDFPPPRNTVWRNYARVFKTELLASDIDGQLRTTDICRDIVEGKITNADDYLTLLIPRIYMPFPAFQDYNPDIRKVYPFSALLKYLLANRNPATGQSAISLEDIFAMIIGNNVSGTEPLAEYTRLGRTPYRPEGDELRQTRELIAFLGQFSLVTWSKSRNILRLEADEADLFALQQIASPQIGTSLRDPSEEILRLGRTTGVEPMLFRANITADDRAFTEGKRERVNHLRIERNPQLRREFFANAPRPLTCDMCGMVPSATYPWVENILEIHHLLPLGSPAYVLGQGTALQDVVGICPNCHRATHVAYSRWLRQERRDDFRTAQEAREVYEATKRRLTMN